MRMGQVAAESSLPLPQFSHPVPTGKSASRTTLAPAPHRHHTAPHRTTPLTAPHRQPHRTTPCLSQAHPPSASILLGPAFRFGALSLLTLSRHTTGRSHLLLWRRYDPSALMFLFLGPALLQRSPLLMSPPFGLAPSHLTLSRHTTGRSI